MAFSPRTLRQAVAMTVRFGCGTRTCLNEVAPGDRLNGLFDAVHRPARVRKGDDIGNHVAKRFVDVHLREKLRLGASAELTRCAMGKAVSNAARFDLDTGTVSTYLPSLAPGHDKDQNQSQSLHVV